MLGEYGVACEWFAQGLSFDLNPELEYVIDMVETYGYALINSGQEQTALFLRISMTNLEKVRIFSS